MAASRRLGKFRKDGALHGARKKGHPVHGQHRGAQFGRQLRPGSDDLLELAGFLCAQLCIGVGCEFRSGCGDAGLQKCEHWFDPSLGSQLTKVFESAWPLLGRFGFPWLLENQGLFGLLQQAPE